MPSGMVFKNVHVLEIFFFYYFHLLCQSLSDKTTWKTHSYVEWTTWTAKSIHREIECTFVNHPSIVSSFNLLWHNKNLHCEHNENWCNKSNPIQKISSRCIRKQTIKLYFLGGRFCAFMSRDDWKKWKKFKNNLKVEISDNCAKKGSSIYALCNNNKEKDNVMLLIFRDFMAWIQAISFVEGSTIVSARVARSLTFSKSSLVWCKAYCNIAISRWSIFMWIYLA